MLPRRHIREVWELIKDDEDFRSMATITLAIDAIKYMHNETEEGPLVEALELNEFICFHVPAKRPRKQVAALPHRLGPPRASHVRHPRYAQTHDR